MPIEIENPAAFNAASPDELFAVVAHLIGFGAYHQLFNKSEQLSYEIENDPTIIDKSAANSDACKQILIEFHKHAVENLVPAAVAAEAIIREACKIEGLQTPNFEEDSTLWLPVPKKFAEQMILLVGQMAGIENIYINTGIEFTNDSFYGLVEYSPADPKRALDEHGDEALTRLLDINGSVAVFVQDLPKVASASSARSRKFLAELNN